MQGEVNFPLPGPVPPHPLPGGISLQLSVCPLFVPTTNTPVPPGALGLCWAPLVP